MSEVFYLWHWTGGAIVADDGAIEADFERWDISGSVSMAAGTGTFLLSGQDATLSLSNTLTAQVGTFVLNGQDASLYASVLLSAGTGTFLLSGQSVILSYPDVVSTEPADLTIIGQMERMRLTLDWLVLAAGFQRLPVSWDVLGVSATATLALEWDVLDTTPRLLLSWDVLEAGLSDAAAARIQRPRRSFVKTP